jgi:hypothetical protein
VFVTTPTAQQFFLQTRRISFNPMLRVTLEVSLHHADEHNDCPVDAPVEVHIC